MTLGASTGWVEGCEPGAAAPDRPGLRLVIDHGSWVETGDLAGVARSSVPATGPEDARRRHPSSSSSPAGRRRSVLGGVLLALVTLGLLVALALPVPWLGGAPAGHVAAATRGGSVLTDRSSYVVRPGDSLWSIAQRMTPDGDPRPIVERLTALNGSATVHPGQRLLLP